MRKNCYSDREKHLKFEAEGREFAKVLKSLEQFIQTVEGQNNFRNRMLVTGCFSDLIQFKLEKIIAIYKPTGKVRKSQKFDWFKNNGISRDYSVRLLFKQLNFELLKKDDGMF